MTNAVQQLDLFEVPLDKLPRVTWQQPGLLVTKVKFEYLKATGEWHVLWATGKVKETPVRVDFPDMYFPAEVRARFNRIIWLANSLDINAKRLGLLTNGVWSSKH